MFLCLLQNELCRYMYMDIVLLESYPTKISEWGRVRNLKVILVAKAQFYWMRSVQHEC